MGRNRKAKLAHGTRVRAKKHVSTAPAPWVGDHGTGTAAQRADTEYVKQEGPNNVAHLRRKDRVRDLIPKLTMRQHQAAQEIQNAYACNEMLSSGGPLKEQVDATPRPDAAIASQVNAQSRLERCTRPLLRSEVGLVRAICWENAPVTQIAAMYPRWLARFATAMDRVADRLGY